MFISARLAVGFVSHCVCVCKTGSWFCVSVCVCKTACWFCVSVYVYTRLQVGFVS